MFSGLRFILLFHVLKETQTNRTANHRASQKYVRGSAQENERWSALCRCDDRSNRDWSRHVICTIIRQLLALGCRTPLCPCVHVYVVGIKKEPHTSKSLYRQPA